MGYITIGVDLRILGRGHRTLGAKTMIQFSDLSF